METREDGMEKDGKRCKPEKMHWSEMQETVFQQLKDALAKVTFICVAESSKPYIL